MAIIFGTFGNDALWGTPDDDLIFGFNGDDDLYGGGGNDTLIGSWQNDSLYGGTGMDTLVGGGGNDYMDGGEDGDTYLVGGMWLGFDTYHDSGTTGTDTILATADNTQIGLAGDFSAANGIEAIDGDGHANVVILGNWESQVLDFSMVTLTGIAYINAGGGDDTVIGSGTDDVIDGSWGNDTLRGGGGLDTLIGGGGNDDMDGGEDGDTYLLGGMWLGYDTFHDSGTTGTDTIRATADNTQIGIDGDFGLANGIEAIDGGGFSNVQILGNWMSQTFDFSWVSLTGIASINTGGGNDTVIGSSAADVIDGSWGNDMLYGRDGLDTLIGGGGNDFLDGGEDSDTYLVGGMWQGFDTFQDSGTVGADVIRATADNTQIGIAGDFGLANGIEGVDGAGFSNVVILGTDASQYLDFSGVIMVDVATIWAGAGDDVVLGTFGDDVIDGSWGNDLLFGGFGMDTLIGGGGNDLMDGGENGDTYLVGGPYTGNDVFGDTGFGGIDTILATANNTRIGMAGNFTQLNGIEVINGGGFANVEIGGSDNSQTFDFSTVSLIGISRIDAGGGNDVVLGSVGGDFIFGNWGNDTLIGGQGNDTLDGGGHNDTLEGDQGDDLFVFHDYDGNNTVTDFEEGASGGDQVDFSGVSGINSFADVLAHAVQNGADTVISYDWSSVTLQNVAVGDLTSGDFLF